MKSFAVFDGHAVTLSNVDFSSSVRTRTETVKKATRISFTSAL